MATNYGRGRGKATAIHVRRDEADRSSGSACGAADRWSCVARDSAGIVNCKRCLALLAKLRNLRPTT